MTISLAPQRLVTAAGAGIGATDRLCLSCGDYLDKLDFAEPTDHPRDVGLIARYGRMTCHACADEHTACIECGKAVKDAEYEHTDNGPVCTDCSATYAADVALEAQHIRQERHGWEQV